ncbi:ABC transporter permease [Rhodoferax sp.]|uniref:ABC transporter permease n=1 Tax=Rhodoferax sp. TaxID=50421 RepID=UPI0025F95DF0|nr:ABC transporter permease [Rhodoferax sp.]
MPQTTQRPTGPLWPLLRSFSWQELRHHPWRNAAAVVSVMLGVALAFSVHLINASALDEFSQAVRSVGGQPDLELRAANPQTGVPLALWGRLLRDPDIALASPVLELSTYAIIPNSTSGKPRVLLRVVGVDTLQVAAVAPDLLPRPQAPAGRNDAQRDDSAPERLAFFAPDAVFLNPAAQQQLPGDTVQLQLGLRLRPVRVAGQVQAGGGPLAVMDIAAVQDLFGVGERISRVDLRLRTGANRQAVQQRLQAAADWPAGLSLREPGDAVSRISNLSRAYRVNLTVLALVALFTGGFLVYSVLALSVSRRSQQFALLAVLGLTGNQRLRLVLAEAAVLGLVGSALGLLLGTGLAALALRLLGGDLGGGYFSGAAPALQWSPLAALIFGGLGTVAALSGAWGPARLARHLPPSQTLKGLGHASARSHAVRWGGVLMVSGVGLALLPPIAGMPLAAYFSVAALLLGGILALPALVGGVLNRVAPHVADHLLPLLAVERARRVRESAAVAVSGVVAALSLAVALTVMVASFRGSVMDWLDQVLPADLYLRTAGSGSAMETAFLDPAFASQAAALSGVARATTQRTLSLSLSATLPPVTLIARPLRDTPGGNLNLPLVGELREVPAGHIGVYVSEAMVDLYGARVGATFPALSQVFRSNEPLAQVKSAQAAPFFIAGVWRDYARQTGAITLDQADFVTLSGDTRVNDMAFWLEEGADATLLQTRMRAVADQLAGTPGGEAGGLLEFGSAREIRATSLRIFDRSFAVTYWLQAVAIGIGLFGVAASFSAQVLARRKEFGLLVHLGLTRRQILRVLALEGAAWTSLGALAGVALGLAVAVVLVHVVNPQSFHWTMELALPWTRLAALAAAVVLAGTVTAWLAGRAAAGRDAVMAVKEDW